MKTTVCTNSSAVGVTLSGVIPVNTSYTLTGAFIQELENNPELRKELVRVLAKELSPLLKVLE